MARDGRGDPLPAELFERSDARGLVRLGTHLTLLACTTGVLTVTLGTALVLPAIALYGIVLIFLFSALHECIHSTAFKSWFLNDAVAAVCGLLLLLPREYFRAFHLTHHRYTQDPERDPELAAKKPETRAEYLLHLSGLPYLRERATTLVRHARGVVTESFIPDATRAVIVREARLHLGVYALAAGLSLATQSWILVVYWIVPALIGQPFLRAFLLAEHTGCPLVPDMLANTRTTLTNPLMRLLSWNMPYHAEHHAWAAVPFHQLPRVHAQVKDRLQYVSPGYAAANAAIWRQLGQVG